METNERESRSEMTRRFALSAAAAVVWLPIARTWGAVTGGIMEIKRRGSQPSVKGRPSGSPGQCGSTHCSTRLLRLARLAPV